MKMLLHLMAKDLRYVRSIPIFYGLCLLVCLSWRLLDRYFELPEATVVFYILAFVFSLSLILGLFLNWIHVDHPRTTDGFLHTRPISAIMRWLPKFLLWGVVVVLPALLTILIQMTLLQIDLRLEDYWRLSMNVLLGLIGCFGAVAAITAFVPRQRLLLALSIPTLIALLAYQNIHSESITVFASPPEVVPWLDFDASRKFVAWNLAGLAGFAFLAWTLARVPARTLLSLWAGVALLCLAARVGWPMNLVRRSPSPVIADSARLQELKAGTKIEIWGTLHKGQASSSAAYNYHSDPILIEPPYDILEWPRVSYEMAASKEVKLSSGEITGTYWREAALPTSDPEKIRQFLRNDFPVPDASLIRLLGLPKDLSVGLTAHEGNFQGPVINRSLILQLSSDAQLSSSARVLAEGQIGCEWYRPFILGEVPLKAGTSFIQDGDSVKVLEAELLGNKLKLRLRLTRRQPWSGMNIPTFDKEPDFQLCVANLKRGEIALKRSSYTSQNAVSLGATELKVSAEYTILSVGKAPPKIDAGWLEQARLYIVRRHSIGTTEQSYRGEMPVSNRP